MPHLDRFKQIYDFIQTIGNLKKTKRFGDNQTIEGDSSADHSWRLAWTKSKRLPKSYIRA